MLHGTCRKDPASVTRMPTATMSATGRRYRGLSAEERRADQRARLVRAAINEFSKRGYHRTSVEDIVRSAHTSRTAFYAFFDNREAAMYGALQASLRGLLDAVRANIRRRESRPEPHRDRRHRVRRLSRLRPGRGADPAARRHRHVARGQRVPRPCAQPGRERRDARSGQAYDPEAAASPAGDGGRRRRVRAAPRVDAAPGRDRPARRGTGARSRARHRGRADARSRRLSSTHRRGAEARVMKLGIVTPVLTLLPRAHATWEETGTLRRRRRDRAGGRAARLPPLHLLGARRDPGRRRRDARRPLLGPARDLRRARARTPRRSGSRRTCSCSATTIRSRSRSATAPSTRSPTGA